MTTPCGLSSWCGLAILGVEGALAASFRRDRAARRLAKCDGGNDNYGFDAKPEQSPALHRHRSCLPSAGETAIVRFRFSLEFAAQARFLVTPFLFLPEGLFLSAVSEKKIWLAQCQDSNAFHFDQSLVLPGTLQSSSACCLRRHWPGSVPGQGARRCSVCYLAVLLQVLEMCFMLAMVSVSWGFSEVPAAGSVSLRELPAFEVEPVIRTSWPTCLLRVELAPCSR